MEALIRAHNNDSLVVRNINPAPISSPTPAALTGGSDKYSSGGDQRGGGIYGPASTSNSSSGGGGYNNNNKHSNKKSRNMSPLLCEPVRIGNEQTDWLLGALGLPHICTVPYTNPTKASAPPPPVKPVEFAKLTKSTSSSSNDVYLKSFFSEPHVHTAIKAGPYPPRSHTHQHTTYNTTSTTTVVASPANGGDGDEEDMKVSAGDDPNEIDLDD